MIIKRQNTLVSTGKALGNGEKVSKKFANIFGPPVAEIFSNMMNMNLISDVTAKVTGYRQAAPDGVWVPGGGIVLPCTYKIYGGIANRNTVRSQIENGEIDD